MLKLNLSYLLSDSQTEYSEKKCTETFENISHKIFAFSFLLKVRGLLLTPALYCESCWFQYTGGDERGWHWSRIGIVGLPNIQVWIFLPGQYLGWLKSCSSCYEGEGDVVTNYNGIIFVTSFIALLPGWKMIFCFSTMEDLGRITVEYMAAMMAGHYRSR